MQRFWLLTPHLWTYLNQRSHLLLITSELLRVLIVWLNLDFGVQTLEKTATVCLFFLYLEHSRSDCLLLSAFDQNNKFIWQ